MGDSDGFVPDRPKRTRKPVVQQEPRRKVAQACIYCRRSHMYCDPGRPCQRCIKRKIAHLCRDDEKMEKVDFNGTSPSIVATSPLQHLANTNLTPSNFTSFTSFPRVFANEQSGQEFNILSEFLASLSSPENLQALLQSPLTTSPPVKDIQVNETEKFFLTAADPDAEVALVETPEDRLARVIHAKFEAGLLKPYNYAASYQKLSHYMDQHMSNHSQQSILSVLNTIRPQFRAIAQSLTDLQLVLVEENFERLLLDYDRVFSTMGIPACLWRRTGEIWKSNRAFAKLVNLDMDQLQEGKTTIYELMDEKSVVNYFEKYGVVAFDTGQKAMLTRCVLYQHQDGTIPHGKKRKRTYTSEALEFINHDEEDEPEDDSEVPVMPISCAFSFTVRRDQHGVPFMIVGNFLPT